MTETRPRELALPGALVRHQVRQYLRALNIEWVEDQSLPNDRVLFKFDATPEQWEKINEWVEQTKVER